MYSMAKNSTVCVERWQTESTLPRLAWQAFQPRPSYVQLSTAGPVVLQPVVSKFNPISKLKH